MDPDDFISIQAIGFAAKEYFVSAVKRRHLEQAE
jgi:hypothetical protein